MDIILLERIEKLGTIGDVVTVKDGYARNFLLPNKKALRANEANRKVFEANRAKIEAEERAKRAIAAGDRILAAAASSSGCMAAPSVLSMLRRSSPCAVAKSSVTASWWSGTKDRSSRWHGAGLAMCRSPRRRLRKLSSADFKGFRNCWMERNSQPGFPPLHGILPPIWG